MYGYSLGDCIFLSRTWVYVSGCDGETEGLRKMRLREKVL